MYGRVAGLPGSIDHEAVGVPSDGIGQIVGSRGDAADAPRQKGGKVREGPHAGWRKAQGATSERSKPAVDSECSQGHAWLIYKLSSQLTNWASDIMAQQ